MPEQLLNVLKLCLLVMLYLFFLRVVRAVWVEVNGPRLRGARRRQVPPPSVPVAATPRRSRRGGRGTPPRPALVVLAPAEAAGRRFDLDDELTVGRAAGCHITLDDTYVSQVHARVFQRDGSVWVEDLGSTNGTYLNRGKVSGPLVVNVGDHVQVGSTVLELVA